MHTSRAAANGKFPVKYGCTHPGAFILLALAGFLLVSADMAHLYVLRLRSRGFLPKHVLSFPFYLPHRTICMFCFFSAELCTKHYHKHIVTNAITGINHAVGMVVTRVPFWHFWDTTMLSLHPIF